MEHVKLAHRPGSGRSGRDFHKRRSGVRCWVVAAALALAITVAFLAIILWLGLNAATRLAAAPAGGLFDPFLDPPPPPTNKMVKSHHAAPGWPLEPPRSTSKKRNNNNSSNSNKGQVEKVRLDARHHAEEVALPTATAAPEVPPASSSSSSTTSSTSTTTTTTTSTTTTSTTSTPPRSPLVVNPQEAVREVAPSGPAYGQQVEVVRGAAPSSPTYQQQLGSAAASHAEAAPKPLWPGGWAPGRYPVLAEARHPVRPVVADLLAEAGGALEWRMPADRRVDDLPPVGSAEEEPIQPHHYDGEQPEEAENPVLSFVQERLRGLRDWLTASGADADWQEVLTAVNTSLYRAEPGLALRKLKDMYYNTSVEPDVPLASLVYPTDPAELSNSSSLVSFGLLAFDLLLLRNVQLLARGEEGPAGQRAEQLMQDPEVRALGALFLPPGEVRRQLAGDSFRSPPEEAEDDSGEELTLGGVLRELASFLTSGLRAVLNLGRAYSATVAGARRQLQDHVQGEERRRDAPHRTPLDCLWTLYCRSLDKTAKLSGPYGFLARMNGLGLRLLLGAVPVEQALDQLVTGWGRLDCSKLFPRCSAEDAVPVALDTALGRTPLQH